MGDLTSDCSQRTVFGENEGRLLAECKRYRLEAAAAQIWHHFGSQTREKKRGCALQVALHLRPSYQGSSGDVRISSYNISSLGMLVKPCLTISRPHDTCWLDACPARYYAEKDPLCGLINTAINNRFIRLPEQSQRGLF